MKGQYDAMKGLLLLGFILLATYADGHAQNRADLVLVNKTGYSISEAYISAVNTNQWKENLIGNHRFDHEAERVIRRPDTSRACRWDLLVVFDDDGEMAIWSSIDFCKEVRVTLHYDRRTDATSATFD